ncbi:aryl hydrocarbon receptor [Ambystoma mexicanum]|uniref:Aryl hydrocarbon receptor n=1 Tax=Ambystoma mexicanum TaxID=8296 RepID=A0A0F6TLE0_AMBME|nr:aryl hydrocarbon receptor [Ambystoma mexicanum]
MNTNATYASRKRRKPVQKAVKPSQSDGAKSNPSKRHRDRLNTELDRLAGLLPFSQDIITKLDKLSVLRLSVSYLRAKGFFEVALKSSRTDGTGNQDEHRIAKPRQSGGNVYLLEGELLLQALNGFVLVVTYDGLVFYTSSTIQDYLGFQQSDVIHQSVFELIHTEDRPEFQRQLHWALDPTQTSDALQIEGDKEFIQHASYYDPDQLPPENSSFMERNFICRLRCLLDNSSGFLAMNFQGRLKFLHGQNQRRKDGSLIPPQLALFSVASPLQSPSILEIRTKNIIFRTKHKLDFTPIGCDAKGSVVLGYTEAELCVRGTGYQFIHAADMMYCAENHVRMMKTGESGMTVFRLLTRDNGWTWVQANARLVYKNGRPDYIIATQRPLMEEEGAEHLRKRNVQLPFMFATGEAVLYEATFPMPGLMDPLPMKGKGKMARGSSARSPALSESVPSKSLLGAMLRQDESVYICPPAPKIFTLSSLLNETKDDLHSILSSDWQDNLVPVGNSNVLKQEQVESPETLNPTFVQDIPADMPADSRDSELYNIMRGLDIDFEDLELIQQDATFFTSELDSSDIRDIDLADEILTYVQESLNRRSDCMFSGSLPKTSTAEGMDCKTRHAPETQQIPQRCQRPIVPPQLCQKMKHMQVNGMLGNWNSVSSMQVTYQQQLPASYDFSSFHIIPEFPFKSEADTVPAPCTQDFPYMHQPAIVPPLLNPTGMDFDVGGVQSSEVPVPSSLDSYLNSFPQNSQSQPHRVIHPLLVTSQPCYSAAVSMYPCIPEPQPTCINQSLCNPGMSGQQPLLNEFQNSFSGGNIIDSYPAQINNANNSQNDALFEPHPHRTEPLTYPDLASSGFM